MQDLNIFSSSSFSPDVNRVSTNIPVPLIFYFSSLFNLGSIRSIVTNKFDCENVVSRVSVTGEAFPATISKVQNLF